MKKSLLRTGFVFVVAVLLIILWGGQNIKAQDETDDDDGGFDLTDPPEDIPQTVEEMRTQEQGQEPHEQGGSQIENSSEGFRLGIEPNNRSIR